MSASTANSTTNKITKSENNMFGLSIFEKKTEAFKTYIKKLKGDYDNQLKEYNALIETYKENRYEYPNEFIFKFDEDNLGDLVLTQELILRTQIIKALSKQSKLLNLGLYNLLSDSGKKMLSGAFCIVLRYKRLYDLFFRASSIKFQRDWLSFTEKKSISDKYNLPNSKQLETIIKYSLDTPLCLNMILNKNGFRKFSNGVELNDSDKVKFDTTDGKIKLGSIASPNGKIQLTMFIDKEGKIKTSDNPTEYDVVGLEFVTFDTGNTGDSSKEPDIKNIDIIEQHKSWVGIGLNWIGNRFLGNEYLPTDDNWNLVWTEKDEDLSEISFVFRKKGRMLGLGEFYDRRVSKGKMKLLKGGRRTIKLQKGGRRT
jgi:hypothetical protein